MWWLLWWFVGISLSTIVVLYGLYKFYTGNKSFWPKNGVFFLDIDKAIPLWDRMSFKIPFHLIEKQMYQLIKNGTGTGTGSGGTGSSGTGSERPKFGGMMEWRTPILVAIDLDLIKAITVKDFDHFVNRREFKQLGADNFSKDMLINKEDQEWRDLRSTLSPTFTTGKIKQMFSVFVESGEKLAKFLDENGGNSGTGNGNATGSATGTGSDDGIDVRAAMTRYTLDVIASTAFGFNSQVFADKNAPFSKWATRLQNPFGGLRFIKVLVAVFVPKLLNLLKISLSDKEALDFFTAVLKETVKQRESSGEKRNDFVQLLIDAKAEKSEAPIDDKSTAAVSAKKTRLTDQLILSQALLFFFAGFDTVETLLIFALYEMALNSEVQDKLFDEISQNLDDDGKLGYETVNRLEYLDKVVSETLRKYPPAVRTERLCTQDYKVPNSNFVLKKGTLVAIPMYGIHHDEEYYPDPEKFDPERFSPENKAARHPYAYFPFGTGPRNCIAMRFALTEGKVALSHMIQKFKFEPSAKTDIPIKVGKVTGFRPEGGLWLKVTRRDL